jgi:hypothetical protein
MLQTNLLLHLSPLPKLTRVGRRFRTCNQISRDCLNAVISRIRAILVLREPLRETQVMIQLD